MSGYPVDVISDRDLIEMGADFISKPFSINEFSIKVREVLYGHEIITKNIESDNQD